MKKILSIFVCIAALTSCHFLDPIPTGNYNEENANDYPRMVRGYIDAGYDALCKHYVSFYYAMGDGCTDNGVLRDHSSAMWQMAQGNPVFDITYQDIYMNWRDAYRGIQSVNLFLENDLGLNMRYFEDLESNDVYRKTLQGDAYGLRAWFHFMLMRHFSGIDENGNLMGIPLVTRRYKDDDRNNYIAKRATFDETCTQIIKDCDSALVYLPLANKDFLRETNETTVCTGAIRHRKLDKMSVTAIKAMTYLAWASPAFCQDQKLARERYDSAAVNAFRVFEHKMTKEYYKVVDGGYDPLSNFLWSDSESPEILFVSQGYYASIVERTFYPSGFFGQGTADYCPSQNLVDCYPMANGYPINDPRSGYDPQKPYENRDPRFYSDFYYDGSKIIKTINGTTTYTFEVADNGKDAPGQEGSTSPTGYYIRKFTYANYSLGDETPDDGYKSVFYIRVNHMLAVLAEALNCNYGPDAHPAINDGHGNITKMKWSAKEAIAFMRAKTTNIGTPGLGAKGDPYLDEVAAKGKDAFNELIRNEWRIEFCWEGQRIFDLRRWNTPLNAPDGQHSINEAIYGVKITTDENGVKHYEYPEVERRHFPSQWLPLPYLEARMSDQMPQNEGWEFYR